MKNNKIFIWLFFLTLLALVLRLWKLGEFPSSLHWDEVSWGYNAYSILKTGRDEYGNFLPFIFKAFGDWKSAIYVYLTVPSVAFFGLNEFSTRLPAAIFGTVSIILAFLLVKEIFKEFREKNFVAFLVSLIFAFSPWHYHYSRGAWEANVLLVFFLLAILFYLKAKKGKVFFFYLSVLFFGLSFYIYNAAKLLIPLVALGLMFFFREKWKQFSLKNYLVGSGIFAILVLPVVYFTFFGGAGGRLKVMSLFSYPRSPAETTQITQEEEGTTESLEFRLFHNDFVYYLRGILGRYLNHFSPRFLFFEGDWSNPRHSVPLSGQMNHLDILLLPLGAYFLISRKIKNQAFLWYFLLIAPLPAALSRDIIQATRSYLMVLPLGIISAFGIYFVWEKIKTLAGVKYWILAFGILIYFFGFVFYLDQFFVHAPKQNSQFWQYGYKEAVNFIKTNKDHYDKIVFTQKYGQPYIYWLFYTGYPPRQYQLQARLTENPEGDVGQVERVDNIEFRDIYWPSDRYLKNTLFVGGPYELPEQDIVPQEAKLLKKIIFLNGETAFHIVETVK